MHEKLEGPQHPSIPFVALNLAQLLREDGRPREALPYMRQAIAIDRRTHGDDHTYVANGLFDLARALHAVGDHADAETALRECVTIQAALLPGIAWRHAMSRSLLGACLAAQERYDEAERELLASLTFFDASDETDPSGRLVAVERLAALYDAWGKPDEAARWRE